MWPKQLERNISSAHVLGPVVLRLEGGELANVKPRAWSS